MNVSEAIAARRSVRAFLDKEPPAAVIRQVIESAQRAPSGGNLQPWHAIVVRGEPLARLKKRMETRVVEEPEAPEYDIYPPSLVEPYRSRRFQVGEALYASIGVAREEKMKRLQQFARNYQFFNAPVALFLHTPRFMGPPQWADMGMWLQTVMLLLVEEGLDSCPQEAWSAFPKTVREFVPIPEDHMLFCGLAIGYRDKAAPINNFDVARAPTAEAVQWLGF